jgi:Ni/Fe-hydrogenase subunit HybB-like protein
MEDCLFCRMWGGQVPVEKIAQNDHAFAIRDINPRAPVHTFIYAPSWVEWSLMAGCFAAFALLYMGFTKLFPIISMWELAPEPEVAPAGGESFNLAEA